MWQASYNLKNQTTEMSSPKGNVGTMDYLDADSTERTSRGGISYTYDVLGLGSETHSDGTTTRYLRDDQGQLVQLITGGKKYFYTFNALGSVTTLSNMNGTRVSSYTYHPYGKGDKGSSDWAPYNPWRFASGYLDKPTGVYKFGTRYYAPQLLRWTQPDPARGQLKNPIHAQNLYAYASDNPVNVTDPSGEFSIFDAWDAVNLADCALQDSMECYAAIALGAMWGVSVQVACIGLAGATGGLAALGCALLGFAVGSALEYMVENS